MARTPILVGLALILLAPASLDAARSKRRKGKVVRVERTKLEGAGVVRLCGQIQIDGTMVCMAPVTPGEIATVVSETGRLATVEVRQVTPQPDGCGNTIQWTVNTDIRSGTLDAVTWMTYAVFDWKIGGQTRMMQNYGSIPPPLGRAGEYINAALDDDADDIPELLLTYFYCDPSGQPSPYGQGGAYCWSYFKRDAASYKELRLDVIKSCY